MSAFVCGFSFVWHLIFSFQKKNLRFSGFDILFGFPICRPGWELGWSAQWTQWFWCKRERFWWKQWRGKRRRRLQYGVHNSKDEVGTSTYFLFRARSRFGRVRVRTKNRLLFCGTFRGLYLITKHASASFRWRCRNNCVCLFHYTSF